MRLHSNDRWHGRFTPPEPGWYLFAIEAWTDQFATWRKEFQLKQEAGQDVTLEAQEGDASAHRTDAARAQARGGWSRRRRSKFASTKRSRRRCSTTSSRRQWRRPRCGPISPAATSCRWSPTANAPAPAPGTRWCRAARAPSRAGTAPSTTASRALPEIAALGFDVLYLTPIHPIGRTNRKGKNNTLEAGPEDPGSFYAIGNEQAATTLSIRSSAPSPNSAGWSQACRRAQHGNRARLRGAVLARPSLAEGASGMVSATGRTARSNSPKTRRRNTRTSSIPTSTAPDRIALWRALRDVILFWVGQGVSIFRVDNPHTKPLPFWEWLIHEVQSRHPDVLFLAEAFTRPKVMKALAKLGFSQSYTYFTWRTEKWELQEYLSETHRLSRARFFPPQFLRHHARHSADPAADRRDLAVQVRAPRWRPPCRRITASTTASS